MLLLSLISISIHICLRVKKIRSLLAIKSLRFAFNKHISTIIFIALPLLMHSLLILSSLKFKKG
jgi:hypothetical protein